MAGELLPEEAEAQIAINVCWALLQHQARPPDVAYLHSKILKECDFIGALLMAEVNLWRTGIVWRLT